MVQKTEGFVPQIQPNTVAQERDKPAQGLLLVERDLW